MKPQKKITYIPDKEAKTVYSITNISPGEMEVIVTALEKYDNTSAIYNMLREIMKDEKI